MLNCRPPPVVYVMSSERAVPVMFMRASRKPLVRPPDGIDMKKRIWLAPVTVYGRIVMLTLDACHSGSGADEMKSLDWASSMLPEMMAALPPSRPDVMVPASSPSSHGQYSRIGASGLLNCVDRKAADWRGLAPEPRRRRMPAGAIGTVTCPEVVLRGGQAGTSPTSRTMVREISASPTTDHERPTESVQAVVPSASPVKSALATSVPSIPARICAP